MHKIVSAARRAIALRRSIDVPSRSTVQIEPLPPRITDEPVTMISSHMPRPNSMRVASG